MEVADYLREFEGIRDELKVLEVVAKMPFDAAMRHYARRVIEVERYAMDLADLLSCEKGTACFDDLGGQLAAIIGAIPK